MFFLDPQKNNFCLLLELIENGFESGTIDGENLYQGGFNIYKFFFEVTEDEWKEWIEKCTNDFCAKYAF